MRFFNRAAPPRSPPAAARTRRLQGAAGLFSSSLRNADAEAAYWPKGQSRSRVAGAQSQIALLASPIEWLHCRWGARLDDFCPYTGRMDNVPGPVVGIIANPVSARDIRRIVSHAGSLQITDRANIVLRILAGLAAAGVGRCRYDAGKCGHPRAFEPRHDARTQAPAKRAFPHSSFLQMNVTGQAADSASAARLMRRMERRGHRRAGRRRNASRGRVRSAAASPSRASRPGTNNAFPETARADDYRPGGRARRDRRRARQALLSSTTSVST